MPGPVYVGGCIGPGSSEGSGVAATVILRNPHSVPTARRETDKFQAEALREVRQAIAEAKAALNRATS